MQNRKSYIRNRFLYVTFMVLAVLLPTSCKPLAPTDAVTAKETTTTNAITNTALMATPEPTADAPRIPPALPVSYQSDYLNPLDAENAQPGTVVMIIMIQGVYKGPVEESGGINVGDLGRMMEQLHEQGFEAINTERFLAFMERNIKIPARSVLIIQDSRRQADNFNKHFRDYWEDWGWPIVNGWQSQPDTLESLWLENITLENEGWVDHQAQGVMVGTYMTDDSSKAVITRELQGSIDAFAERFGKTPIAFIWPGGGFGQRPVQAARQLGYQLGFTLNSRGPVMYNWVPLATEVDPQRPSLIPEAQIGDPLMTLPRYWPYQVSDAIDQVRIMGNEAAAYAHANKAVELEYYDVVCVPTHGPLPSP
jgi:hypothetical protein